MTGVTDGPFPVTRTLFFPMLDKGSSFLDCIFAYMSLLNLVVISARIEYLQKKKVEKGRKNARLIQITYNGRGLYLLLFSSMRSKRKT